MFKSFLFLMIVLISSNCFSQDSTKKTLMIFTSKKCHWCEKLKETISEPEVIESLDDYVLFYVDIKQPENKNLVEKYKIKSIPHCVIVDEKEEILKQQIGYQNKNQLINWLKN